MVLNSERSYAIVHNRNENEAIIPPPNTDTSNRMLAKQQWMVPR